MTPITYTCRGPVAGVITADDIAAGDYPPGTEGHTKRGIAQPVPALPGTVAMDAQGHVVVTAPDAATRLAPCGADLTALIATVPADGHIYTVTCPSCGATSTIRRT